MSNEAFEKWLKENYLVDMSEFIVDEQERTYIKENNLLRKAWQAATAESENRIAEVKQRALEESNKYVAYCDLAEAKIVELQSNINILREALEEIAETNASKHGTTRMMLDRALYITNEALSKTPAQHIKDDVVIFDKKSLQEHDNEVIEKCAKVCESSDRHRGEYFATKIRALKG